MTVQLRPTSGRKDRGHSGTKPASEGPQIAQFLEVEDLCPRCQLIANNNILITQLCPAYGATYLLKLVKISSSGAIEIKRVSLENRGKPTALDDLRDKGPTVDGYDPLTETFV